jgi:hypothetical protein
VASNPPHDPRAPALPPPYHRAVMGRLRSPWLRSSWRSGRGDDALHEDPSADARWLTAAERKRMYYDADGSDAPPDWQPVDTLLLAVVAKN